MGGIKDTDRHSSDRHTPGAMTTSEGGCEEGPEEGKEAGEGEEEEGLETLEEGKTRGR